MNNIKILNTDVSIKNLSTKQILECIQFSNYIAKKLKYKNISNELIICIAERVALCLFCVYKNNSPLFSSWEEIIKKLSIDDLDLVFKTYDELYNYKD